MCDKHEVVEDDKGPWQVDVWKVDGRQKVVLQSHDGVHDVALEISGDFACFEQRLEYAHKLVRRMNEIPETRSVDWRMDRNDR